MAWMGADQRYIDTSVYVPCIVIYLGGELHFSGEPVDVLAGCDSDNDFSFVNTPTNLVLSVKHGTKAILDRQLPTESNSNAQFIMMASPFYSTRDGMILKPPETEYAL